MLWSWQAVGLGFKPKSVQLQSPRGCSLHTKAASWLRNISGWRLDWLSSKVGQGLFQHWNSRSQLKAYGEALWSPFYSKICFWSLSPWSGGYLPLWHGHSSWGKMIDLGAERSKLWVDQGSQAPQFCWWGLRVFGGEEWADGRWWVSGGFYGAVGSFMLWPECFL